MKQEEKQLLLQDLCARLPYGVMIQLPELFYPSRMVVEKLVGIDGEHINDSGMLLDYVRPYLRPMDSMTEEEYKELKSISPYYGFAPYESIGDWGPNYEMIDWLNAHHFDYRGLIEKGLALVAPEGMYNLENK